MISSRTVNIRYPLAPIFRIVFAKRHDNFQGHPLDFVMKLRGINNGFYGDVSMSVTEMQQLRNAIDEILKGQSEEARSE